MAYLTPAQFASQSRSLDDLPAIPNAPGFTSTIKRTGGQMLGGIGEAYGDLTGNRANWAAHTAEDIIARNPSGINSLQDVWDKPGLAATEAGANALTFLIPYLGAGKALQLMNAGRVATTAAQAALAGVPSLGEIGESQRETGSENLALKYGGAGLVGLIENLGGMQRILGPKYGKEMTEAAARGAVASPLKTFGKQWGRVGLEEGAEELAQTPIEQFAGGKPMGGEEMALGGVMGTLGGLVLGPLGAGAHRSQASKLTRQIDEARGALAAPLESLDQLPVKQQASDFLTKVTANDFGGARALEFAQAQSEAAVQDRDVLLENIAQTKEAEELAKAKDAKETADIEAMYEEDAQRKARQTELVKMLEKIKTDEATAQTAAESRAQQELDNSFKALTFFQKIEQDAKKDQADIAQEKQDNPPTDLLGGPLYSPLSPPTGAEMIPEAKGTATFRDFGNTFADVNDYVSTGLSPVTALDSVYASLLERSARGFGTTASPNQLPLLGPKGGVAPGQAAATPAKVTPRQKVAVAQAAGAITEDQAVDLVNDIDTGAKPQVVLARLQAAQTTVPTPTVVPTVQETQNEPSPVEESPVPAQEGQDAVPSQEEALPELAPYAAGAQAAQDGLIIDTNPHPEGSVEAGEWARGWLDTKHPTAKSKVAKKVAAPVQALAVQDSEADAAKALATISALPGRTLGSKKAKVQIELETDGAFTDSMAPVTAIEFTNEKIRAYEAMRKACLGG